MLTPLALHCPPGTGVHRKGLFLLGVQGGEDALGGEWDLGDTDADGVFDGVGDGRGDGNARGFADAFGAEGP